MSDTKNSWDILTLTGEKEHLEIVSALITEPSLGMTENDQSLDIYFKQGNRINIQRELKHSLKVYPVQSSWREQVQEDWHLAWQENFTPIFIRDAIAVIPEWDEHSYEEPHIIRIRPGMAFGTGHHETTHLMLETMIDKIDPGDRVLDLGTGSGILAIAAHKLGASIVIGVEFDEDCRGNFEENVELNKIDSSVSFIKADVRQWYNVDFELILANINRNILLEMIPNLSKSSARIILSGLLTSDEQIIRTACQKTGLKILAVHVRGEWIAMEVKQK